MGQRVLVIGSGGREHALAWKLSQSPRVEEVLVGPGNDGMRDVARRVDAGEDGGWAQLARREKVDLVVIGPENPLVEGLADRLRAAGLAVFGPSAAAARLEGDKAFAKAFMEAAGVPTARAEIFDDATRALRWLDEHPGRWVVKAAGLAAGKGVIVCDDAAQASEAVHRIMQEQAFGTAGATVVIEERLEGPELSVFAVLDGHRAAWFAPSRDHKRLLEGDRGPNTGGMGAFTPVPDVDEALMRRVIDEVLDPTVEELRRRGLDYRGLLYLGLMLTADGPRLLEYNCRFGDPETQVVLPAYPGDLYELLDGAARGHLPVEGGLPREGAAVGFVLASEGYPVSPRKGLPIDGLEGAEGLIFHAGTRRHEGRWLTAGGRVLCAVARADELGEARRRALHLAEGLRFPGAQIRRDIAAREAAS